MSSWWLQLLVLVLVVPEQLKASPCGNLSEGFQLVPGCRLATNQAEVTCNRLLTPEAGTTSTKSLLISVRFLINIASRVEYQGSYMYNASYSTAYFQVWSSVNSSYHPEQRLSQNFATMLPFFTEESYLLFSFPKNFDGATVILSKEDCMQGLETSCVECVKALSAPGVGAADLSFSDERSWNSLKRHFVDVLGARMTRLSLVSTGHLPAVALPFLQRFIKSDLGMEHLTLANLSLGQLDAPLIRMPTLLDLKLPHDHITSISEETLGDLPSLRLFDLSHNLVQRLPTLLPGSLTTLNVSNNQLEELTETLPEGLLQLDVSHNKIQDLPDTLPPNLLTLDVSSNSLSTLPLDLPPTLRYLSASHNRLQSLTWILPEALEYVQVSHNQLHTVGPLLQSAGPRLQLLDLSHNALSDVEDLWLAHSVRLLNLSGNRLTSLRLRGPGRAQLVDASYNHIEAWQVQADTLSLVGNPRAPLGLEMSDPLQSPLSVDFGDDLLLNCDPCSADSNVTLQLWRWLSTRNGSGSPRVMRPNRPECTEPVELAGRPLLELEESSLENASGCNSSSQHIVEYSLLALSILGLVAAIVAVGCFLRHEIQYICHLIKLRKESIPDEKCEVPKYKYDAFVCYSSADRAWVLDAMLPTLERRCRTKSPPLRLCLHDRDFSLGPLVVRNIISGMQNSRATVVVLSRAFVASQWCRWEAELAAVEVPRLVVL